jgi:hypothetical protein
LIFVPTSVSAASFVRKDTMFYYVMFLVFKPLQVPS